MNLRRGIPPLNPNGWGLTLHTYKHRLISAEVPLEDITGFSGVPNKQSAFSNLSRRMLGPVAEGSTLPLWPREPRLITMNMCEPLTAVSILCGLPGDDNEKPQAFGATLFMVNRFNGTAIYELLIAAVNYISRKSGAGEDLQASRLAKNFTPAPRLVEAMENAIAPRQVVVQAHKPALIDASEAAQHGFFENVRLVGRLMNALMYSPHAQEFVIAGTKEILETKKDKYSFEISSVNPTYVPPLRPLTEAQKKALIADILERTSGDPALQGKLREALYAREDTGPKPRP